MPPWGVGESVKQICTREEEQRTEHIVRPGDSWRCCSVKVPWEAGVFYAFLCISSLLCPPPPSHSVNFTPSLTVICPPHFLTLCLLISPPWTFVFMCFWVRFCPPCGATCVPAVHFRAVELMDQMKEPQRRDSLGFAASEPSEKAHLSLSKLKDFFRRVRRKFSSETAKLCFSCFWKAKCWLRRNHNKVSIGKFCLFSFCCEGKKTTKGFTHTQKKNRF